MIEFFPPVILIVVYALVAVWYREKLRTKYNADVGAYNSLKDVRMRAIDFDSGFFDCCNGRKAGRKCCFATWCPPVRWSTNASATGFMEFWIALIISSIFINILFIFGLLGRIHIRALAGMRKQPVTDCLGWFCCYCCALTQESKFVDKGFYAIRNGQREARFDERPQVASVVEKRLPETPATTPPRSPQPGAPELSTV
jgi:Cys-rich protein (TIGR01571 family)